MTKTGRNEPCWCGSGRKYKYCHLRRADEQPRPASAIAHEMRRVAAHRTCLHPQAGKAACGKVVSAHTLQRSRVLAAIADEDKHVLTFYPAQHTGGGRLAIHRRGWHQSSTFDAFCEKHDSQTFAPLEATQFAGTKEQLFLIAYRAICWELYQKRRATKASPVLRDLVDRGMPEHLQRQVQIRLAVQQSGFEKGLAELSALKQRMDAALLASDFGLIESLELALEGTLGIASTGAITPNRSRSGRQLQTLHDDSRPMQWLAFGVDLRQSHPSAVFIWLKGEIAPRSYVDDILSLPPDERATFLAQFFFAHCENTYFSAAWWDSLSEGNRRHLEELMGNANPYYFPPKYNLDAEGLAPWRTATLVSD
jgi:hypothetical protein